MNKNISQSFKIVALASVLSVGISYVSAWTAPTVTPPGGNVAAPLNTGDNVQYKTGTLVLNDNSTNPFINGLIVRYGNVGIGTTNPTQKLDVLGGNIAARVADSTSRVGFVAQSNYGQAVIFSGGGHGAGMGFYTDSISAAGPTDAKMVIQTATGNVGIGVSEPTKKLEVAGDIKASGTICDTTGCIGGSGNVASYNNLPTGATAGWCVNKYSTSVSSGGIGSYTPTITGNPVLPATRPDGYTCDCSSGWTAKTTGSVVSDANQTLAYSCIKN